MSPDLKSVDNQDIQSPPQDHPYFSKILTTSLSFRWFLFSPNLYGNKFKADGCNQGFCTGFISIASPTEWSLSFSSSYKSKIIPRRILATTDFSSS
jgi:hypothetical protein